MRGAGLALASAALRAATALRRSLHGAGLLPTRALPVPVVSVGNLAAGGAGKTPIVEYVAKVLRAQGARPAVLARGYGPKVGATGLNDEGCVLAENLPGIPQFQDPDRVAAGRRALAGGGVDCLLLDDALQHFRIARDLDVVALDARRPFRGGLRREGPGALRRAGVVVLTRASRASPAELDAARTAVESRGCGPAVVADHAPADVLPLGGGPARPPGSLRGAAVFACAGIADPSAFVHTLEALGARVKGWRGFPDHGLASLAALGPAFGEARRAGAERVVVTQKDAVKIAASGGGPPDLPVDVLRVRLEVLEGAAVLEMRLAEALERGRRRASAG